MAVTGEKLHIAVQRQKPQNLPCAKHGRYEKQESPHQVGTDKEAPNKPTHSRTLKPKRQGADPGPLFFHVPDRPHRFPQGNARASAGRIRATAIPTGTSLPHTASLSAGNCHGAEPTFDPALLPAADNRPAASRGGPPSRRHPSNATFNTKSCLLATYITHLSAADFCDNRYIYTTARTHHTALYYLRTTKLTKPFLSMGGYPSLLYTF